jgi:hypothetical protein
MSIPYRFDAVADTRSAQERDYLQRIGATFEASPFSTLEKLMNFPLYVPRQNLTTFLVKYEIFKRILNVHGSIIECGVGFGGGLLTWAQLSAILEPTNHTRRIIGFDSFAGFPSVSEHDTAHVGDLSVDSQAEIEACVRLYDQNRFVGHIPKVELVKGNACETIPQYVKDNPYLVVSLCYLDFDIYQPTLTALQQFRCLMPKGAIIAFDELNLKEWPGETQAVAKDLGLNNLTIERCAFGSTISWAVL